MHLEGLLGLRLFAFWAPTSLKLEFWLALLVIAWRKSLPWKTHRGTKIVGRAIVPFCHPFLVCKAKGQVLAIGFKPMTMCSLKLSLATNFHLDICDYYPPYPQKIIDPKMGHLRVAMRSTFMLKSRLMWRLTMVARSRYKPDEWCSRSWMNKGMKTSCFRHLIHLRDPPCVWYSSARTSR
jgi:hypothetical protein